MTRPEYEDSVAGENDEIVYTSCYDDQPHEQHPYGINTICIGRS